MLRKIFYNTYITVEKERERFLLSNNTFDYKALWVTVYTAFALSMIYYLGRYEMLKNFLRLNNTPELIQKVENFLDNNPSNNLTELTYWVFMLVLFYFVIPAFIIKYVFKERLGNYGFKMKGAFKDYHLYIIMLMVMIPLVLYFSTTIAFQERYPFLISTSGLSFSDLLKWELLYMSQFIALEFFFRGFLLHGLKHRFGFYSVFIMTIPYCMIHFGKPMQETLAAIVAGVVLGVLSLKSNSVFLGCLIHISVGIGMDFASLWQKGFFN